jgi:hypothetical protein
MDENTPAGALYSGTEADAAVLPVCGPPDTRVVPRFNVFFRRFVSTGVTSLDESAGFTVACVPAAPGGIVASLGLDLRFDQTWSLEQLSIGDLSSTIALAPLEELTLEFQSTQRRVLDQLTVDSAETQDQLDSTTIDKEVMSVARSASHNHSWRVDGNGSFSLSGVTVGASASVQDALTSTSQSSMEHTTEATTKASHNLKTLHKIEVRGITEGAVTNRMTRTLRNPYRDRTLALNVFQLVKHFQVRIEVAEVRPALSIAVNDLVFDEDFVVTNGAFLRANLLDLSLLDVLSEAAQAALPVASSASDAARTVATTALRFLFDEPNVFNVIPVPINSTTIPPFSADPNDPASAFDMAGVDARDSLDENQSGLSDALRNGFAPIFTTLNFFYRVYREMASQLADNAISMAVAISTAVGPAWTAALGAPSDQLSNLFDTNDFTEPFRRLSGFLGMVDGMLRPLIGPAEDEQKLVSDHARGRILLGQITHHLNCNKNYYIQSYLRYLADSTRNQAIVDLVDAVITAMVLSDTDREALRQQLDIERAFIDRQDIIVPAFDPMTGGVVQLPTITAASDAWHPPPPVEAELEVPSDGIHMEVAAGTCILHDVPDDGTVVDVGIKDASLHVETR